MSLLVSACHKNSKLSDVAASWLTGNLHPFCSPKKLSNFHLCTVPPRRWHSRFHRLLFDLRTYFPAAASSSCNLRWKSVLWYSVCISVQKACCWESFMIVSNGKLCIASHCSRRSMTWLTCRGTCAVWRGISTLGWETLVLTDVASSSMFSWRGAMFSWSENGCAGHSEDDADWEAMVTPNWETMVFAASPPSWVEEAILSTK